MSSPPAVEPAGGKLTLCLLFFDASPRSWIDEFVKRGGYVGLLERLKDLLEKEWR